MPTAPLLTSSHKRTRVASVTIQTKAYTTRRLDLDENDRRIILSLKLYQKRNRCSPAWFWIRKQTDLSHSEFQRRMHRLRWAKYIAFSPKPRSTWARPAGVKAALEQRTSDG